MGIKGWVIMVQNGDVFYFWNGEQFQLPNDIDKIILYGSEKADEEIKRIMPVDGMKIYKKQITVDVKPNNPIQEEKQNV